MAELVSVPGGKAPGPVAPPGVNEIDEQLVEAVVGRLNRLHAAVHLSLYRAFGEVLLDAFYQGDLDVFAQIGRNHASLNAVLEHEGLRPKGSQAWYALNLLPQLRMFGDELSEALPMSHHRILMHVRDEHAKLDLAKRAATGSLSKRALEVEVEQWRRARQEQPDRRRPVRRRKVTAEPVHVAAVPAKPVVRQEESETIDEPRVDDVELPTPAGRRRVAPHGDSAKIEEAIATFLRAVALARQCRVNVQTIAELNVGELETAIDEAEGSLGQFEEFLDDVGQTLRESERAQRSKA